MIVYLESNFVLELAFLQAEHEECSAILRLAETGEIRLVLPAFSIGEPYETWRFTPHVSRPTPAGAGRFPAHSGRCGR